MVFRGRAFKGRQKSCLKWKQMDPAFAWGTQIFGEKKIETKWSFWRRLKGALEYI